jgi:nucleoid-associated protein YgaU
MEGILMNRHLHKGTLVTVSIITALIFSVSGCGLFKSSKTDETGKSQVAEKPAVAEKKAVIEKKADEQSSPFTDKKTKVIVQSDTEQQLSEIKKSPAAKESGKQSKMAGNIYVVKKGECLWNIAKAVYNKPLKWKVIYKANKKKIKDPNLIYPNQKLIIPEDK